MTESRARNDACIITTMERQQPFWFFRLAERVRMSPIAFAVIIALAISVVTLVIESLAGPIQYDRKPFESLVPHMMASTVLLSVSLLYFSERWASDALTASRPFVRGIEVDPTRHSSAVVWGGFLTALPPMLVFHETNTARWSRFATGDWNLFDVWVVLVVALGLVLSFQISLIVLALARRVGRWAADPIDLELFDSNRGRSITRYALRVAFAFAIFGVVQGASGLAGAWAFWPGVITALVNFFFSMLLFSLCMLPFVRSMNALKRAELSRVQRAISGDARALSESSLGHHLELLDLLGLLAYRREVVGVSSWPLDSTHWGRLVLYLVLPPLSWVAAAIVEELVQGRI